MNVLVWINEKMALGHENIDQAHKEIIDLINVVAKANSKTFSNAFTDLVCYTREHFEFEQKLMELHQDPARREHKYQHTKLLGELSALEKQVKRGQFKLARSFVTVRLPEWLDAHTSSMDSMLVAHLNQR
ncbi:MAG: Bacteriohemerythrin [Hyphomicrobiaceae bacterium hypho_1]